MNRITQYAIYVPFLATIGKAVVNVIHSTRNTHFHFSTVNIIGQERLLASRVNVGLAEEHTAKLFPGGTASS